MIKEMSVKKKMTIALAAMGTVTLAAVVGFTAVLAASRTTVTNNINISYTAGEVSAKVTTKYYHNTSAEADFTTIQTDATPAADFVTFNGEEEDDSPEASAALKGTNLTLAKGNARYAVFEYKFEKGGATTKDFTATLTYTDTGTADSNMSMGYITSDTAKTKADFNTDALVKAYFDGEGDEAVTIAAGTATSAITVSADKYVYVLVRVTDISLDAELSGGFSWALELAPTE